MRPRSHRRRHGRSSVAPMSPAIVTGGANWGPRLCRARCRRRHPQRRRREIRRPMAKARSNSRPRGIGWAMCSPSVALLGCAGRPLPRQNRRAGLEMGCWHQCDPQRNHRSHRAEPRWPRHHVAGADGAVCRCHRRCRLRPQREGSRQRPIKLHDELAAWHRRWCWTIVANAQRDVRRS